ncbi:MAG: hypothetical protein QXW01_03400 [Candidatus Aenigmatarchaeota archaeon]
MSNYFSLIFWDLQRKKGFIDLEELENINNSRECMLRCLYSIKVLYERLDMPYEEFEERYKKKKNSEIRKILNRKIKKYNKSSRIERWAEELTLLRYARRLKTNRARYIESPMYSSVDSIIDFLIEVSYEFGKIE